MITTERLSRDEFIATLDLSQLRGEVDGETTLKPTMAPRLRSPYRVSPLKRLSQAVFSNLRRDEDLALKGTLAEGGMGIIKLAEQPNLKREVAVKTLKDEFLDQDLIERLLREARITGLVEHPNIVPLYSLSYDHRGAPLLVMKRIEGESFRSFIRGDCEPPAGEDRLEFLLTVLLSVCDAVHYAHSRGILHLDLKPDNVMIGAFRDVYLVDWGVACSINEEHRGFLPLADELTEVLGTPAYMPPEMVDPKSGKLGTRSDVYLLGGLLFEILANRPPHEGESIKDLLYAAYRGKIGPLPKDTPRELAAIVRRAMAVNPARRYASAEEFRQAVANFVRYRPSVELAEQSMKELGAIRDELGRMDERSEMRTKELLRRFAECRFGFALALREWQENSLAREGLAEATLLMAGFHIDHGEADAAEALLDERLELDGGQSERLSALREAIALLRAEAARMEEMRAQQDDGAARRARALYILIAAIAFNIPLLIAWVLTQIGLYRYESWHSLAFSTLLSGLLGAAALGMRRELMPNRASRRMVLAICVTSVLLVLRRLVALALGREEIRDIATDLFTFGSCFAVLATITDRRLFSPAIAFITAAPFVIRFPDHTFLIVAIASLIGIGSTSAMWLVSDRRRRRRRRYERELKERISFSPPPPPEI